MQEAGPAGVLLQMTSRCVGGVRSPQESGAVCVNHVCLHLKNVAAIWSASYGISTSVLVGAKAVFMMISDFQLPVRSGSFIALFLHSIAHCWTTWVSR